MKPNDETIYGGMPVENEENPQVMNEKEGKKEVPWKYIGLGAVTGILMGAGALYATDAMAASTSEEPGEASDAAQNAGKVEAPAANMPVAENITGDTFEHAFAEARAQVGPGGLFQWHGGIYNTYTKEEWDALSDSSKEAFAAKVHPEHPVSRINTIHITEKDPDIHIDTVEIHEHKTVVINEPTPENNDDDVHVVHYKGTDEININGHDISVENYEVDGHEAAVVNFHDEKEHDIAWVDKNDNLNVDDAEAKDLVTNELLDHNLDPMPNPSNLVADASGIDVTSVDLSPEI